MNKYMHKVIDLSIEAFSISICVDSMALYKLLSNRSQNQKAVFTETGASSFFVG